MQAKLVQVVDGADELPLPVARRLSSPHEGPHLPVLLDLAERRLDRRSPDLVARLSFRRGEIVGHPSGRRPGKGRQGRVLGVVLVRLEGLDNLLALPGGRSENLEGLTLPGRHVVLAVVAGVGQERVELAFAIAQSFEVAQGVVQHGMQLLEVVLFRRHGGGQDDLISVDDDLGVVPLEIAPGGLHDLALRIGRVDLVDGPVFGFLFLAFSPSGLSAGLLASSGALFVPLLLFLGGRLSARLLGFKLLLGPLPPLLPGLSAPPARRPDRGGKRRGFV